MAKLFNLLALVSVIGAHVISINLNFMQLSLYRGILALIIMFFVVQNLVKYKNIRFQYKKNNRYLVFFNFFWLFYAVLTLFWVDNYELWLKSIFFIGSGAIVVILMIFFLYTDEKIINIYKYLFYMVLLNNILGWYEVITSNYLFLDESLAKYNSYFKIPVSVFGNANDYALLLLFGVFISIMYSSNAENAFGKLVGVIVFVSSIILCFFTNSRANMIGIFIGLIIYLLLLLYKNLTWKKIFFGYVFIFFITMIFVLFKINIFSAVLDKLYLTLDFEGGSDYTRLNLIRNGLYFLVMTGGFGTGAGNIEHWMSNKSVYNVQGLTNIHNWWAEILVGYGIFVFIGYLMMYSLMMKKMFCIFKNSRDRVSKNIAMGTLAIMFAFIVASISSSSNINKEWLWFFWGISITFINHFDENRNRRLI